MKKVFITLAIGLSFMAEALDLQGQSVEDELFTYTAVNNKEASCRPSFQKGKVGFQRISAVNNEGALCRPSLQVIEEDSIQRIFGERALPRRFVSISGIPLKVTSMIGWGRNTYIEPNTVLKEVCIPSSIKLIDTSFFKSCMSLKEVAFEPDSELSQIENYAFAFCRPLESIAIPKSVKSIGRNCFWNCHNLSSVTFEEDSQLEHIGENAFNSCRSLESITIPASVKSIDCSCFNSCNNLSTVTFEEDSQLEHIGNFAFGYCRSLESITIPASVKSIEGACFNCCENLRELIFEPGSQLEQISINAFRGCNSLNKIIAPSDMNLPLLLNSLVRPAMIFVY
jgi:hypothetical protein